MKKKVASYAELFRRLLDESELNAYRLCLLSGVPQSSVSLFLSGERKPSVESLEKLLRAAGKEWSWLDDNLVAVELPPKKDS